MTRKYELKRRAERQAETRRRIVAAALELHATVGFVDATITAVAERAGVERLTLYRHFPNEQELVGACAWHFFGLHPLPDPAPWRRVGDPATRLRTALREVYAWNRQTEPNMSNFLRDAPRKPFLFDLGAPLFEQFGVMRDVLAGGWRARGPRRRRLVAAIDHALDFRTWQMLVRERGLDDEDAIELMLGLVKSA